MGMAFSLGALEALFLTGEFGQTISPPTGTNLIDPQTFLKNAKFLVEVFYFRGLLIVWGCFISKSSIPVRSLWRALLRGSQVAREFIDVETAKISGRKQFGGAGNRPRE